MARDASFHRMTGCLLLRDFILAAGKFTDRGIDDILEDGVAATAAISRISIDGLDHRRLAEYAARMIYGQPLDGFEDMDDYVFPFLKDQLIPEK